MTAALREDFPADQGQRDAQGAFVGGEQDNRPSQLTDDAQSALAGPVHTSPQASVASLPMSQPPAGSKPASSHSDLDAQKAPAAGFQATDSHETRDDQGCSAVGSDHPADRRALDAQGSLVGGVQTEDGVGAALADPLPRRTALADPFLALAADVVDDTERTRIANENRLRQLTRTGVDADGQERGFGLDESHPDVARLAALVDALARIEHQATLNLNRAMRQHPLGAWGKQQKGVGEKQLARLLAVIGDPYWNTLYDRPRTVSELWAYCGLHVLLVGQRGGDDHIAVADGELSSTGGDPSHGGADPQGRSAGVAARRRKGQRANWSTLAKTRAYLIAESMLRAGNRDIYDTRKAHTEGKMHAAECVRCGPSGKPAQPGTPWSDGHRHADALRITSKELLKALWLEARRIHQGEQ